MYIIQKTKSKMLWGHRLSSQNHKLCLMSKLTRGGALFAARYYKVWNCFYGKVRPCGGRKVKDEKHTCSSSKEV